MAELKTRIILRNDTTAGWEAVKANDTYKLLKGEIGIEFVESGSPKMKIGDGTSTWADLPYFGGTATQLYEATLTADETHSAAIARVTSGAQINSGDFVVVKEAVGTDKYQYTAYVYAADAWKALDGNYNAENVYFDKDLTITANVGVQTIGATGSKTLATTGKNVKQVLDLLFAEEKNPSVTKPSVTITLTGAGAKEVGTSVTPSYSVGFNKGKYEFGPDTGVTATYAVSDTASHSATTATGSFDAFTVEPTTNYKVSVTATHTAGADPVSNLGNGRGDLKITAGEKTATSAAITGYRGWFQGYYNGTQALADATTITSAQLRAFGVKNGTFNTTMNTNKMQQMFFAAPAGTVKTLTVSNAVNGAPQTVKKTTVPVEGANNYQAIDYDLYYVANATAESGDSKFTIAFTK